MAPLLRVEGTWPDPITFTLGWFRARARPWNEEVADPMLRLERGGTEFLEAVSARLHELAETVYSPALYPGSTRVWRRGGFEPHAELEVMERALTGDALTVPEVVVEEGDEGDWPAVLEVDRAAFAGFWGMSRLGLEEAHGTNRSNAMLVAYAATPGVAGYALVGAQWGIAYLHRIAVHPNHTGRGVGSALLGRAMTWGRSQGGKSIVLNVRPENDAARRLYERHGFTNAGSRLEVLRHGAARLLN